MEKSTLRDRAPTQVKLIERNRNFGRQDGGKRKNKFKEQRHQGKLLAFLQVLQGKPPKRKGSRRWGCWGRLGDTESTAKCLPAWRGARCRHLWPTGGEGKGILGGEGGAMPWRQGCQRKLGWKLHSLPPQGLMPSLDKS